MGQNAIMSELASNGYTSIEVVDYDSHATYYEAEQNGTRYEFKTCRSEWHDDIELWQRQEGKEDWWYLYDISE